MWDLPKDEALTSRGKEGTAHIGYKGDCHCAVQAWGRTVWARYMPVGGDRVVVTTSWWSIFPTHRSSTSSVCILMRLCVCPRIALLLTGTVLAARSAFVTAPNQKIDRSVRFIGCVCGHMYRDLNSVDGFFENKAMPTNLPGFSKYFNDPQSKMWSFGSARA